MLKLRYFAVVVAVFFILFPIYWQVCTALKPSSEIFSKPITWFPESFTFENFRAVLTSGHFITYLKNSAFVATGTTILCLIFGSFAGYALGRLKMKLKNVILWIVLSVSMFPQIAIVSPLFLFLKKLGLLNTYPGLIIPYCTFALPLSIWMLTNFFRELPQEIEEQSFIDGCSPVQSLSKVILPLSLPGMAATAILVFIFAWNEFLFALTFNTRQDMRTVPVGVAMFPGLYEIPWGTIFAASTIVTFPLIIMVFLLQRRIVSGLTAGAIK
ncbi:MAG: carbohydrate ABC transporter permease [Elusimicrobia bacterium]|nr:carbohydrate ABC transporter permease [Elusimicrobiota bacterium]